MSNVENNLSQLIEEERLSPQQIELVRKRYELISFLGQGATGVVFRAKNQEMEVAIKILTDTSYAQERRFQKEGKILLGLHHQHIIKTYRLLEEGGKVFAIEMEYFPGQNLAEYKNNSLVLSDKEIAKIGLMMTQGTAYAHEKGIIHRDLKDTNALYNGEELRIIDFGIGKIIENQDTILTKTGMILGTPGFGAPEIINPNSDKVKDETKIDSFGIGAVMYWLSTGHYPFGGNEYDNPLEVLSKVSTKGSIIRPKEYVKISKELEKIILSATSPNPDERASIEELKRYLTDFAQGKEVNIRNRREVQKQTIYPKRRKLIIGGTIITAAGLTGTGFLAYDMILKAPLNSIHNSSEKDLKENLENFWKLVDKRAVDVYKQIILPKQESQTEERPRIYPDATGDGRQDDYLWLNGSGSCCGYVIDFLNQIRTIIKEQESQTEELESVKLTDIENSLFYFSDELFIDKEKEFAFHFERFTKAYKAIKDLNGNEETKERSKEKVIDSLEFIIAERFDKDRGIIITPSLDYEHQFMLSAMRHHKITDYFLDLLTHINLEGTKYDPEIIMDMLISDSISKSNDLVSLSQENINHEMLSSVISGTAKTYSFLKKMEQKESTVNIRGKNKNISQVMGEIKTSLIKLLMIYEHRYRSKNKNSLIAKGIYANKETYTSTLSTLRYLNALLEINEINQDPEYENRIITVTRNLHTPGNFCLGGLNGHNAGIIRNAGAVNYDVKDITTTEANTKYLEFIKKIKKLRAIRI
jgi:serine/threonine protein kinase